MDTSPSTGSLRRGATESGKTICWRTEGTATAKWILLKNSWTTKLWYEQVSLTVQKEVRGARASVGNKRIGYENRSCKQEVNK